MESLFGDLFRLRHPILFSPENLLRPLADVYETEREIVVKLEIAGVKEGEIDISLEDDILIIRGIREEMLSQREKRCYYKIEINYGPFQREIRLPAPVLGEEMKVSYEAGMLEIRLAKVPESPKVVIEIE